MRGELFLQEGSLLFDGGVLVVLGAPGFESHEFLELVTPGDQGRQRGPRSRWAACRSSAA